MSAAVARPPAKRVLMETTNTRSNIVPSPHSAKKRKLDGTPVKTLQTPSKGPRSSQLGSSQQKSEFEEHLEKLTQDISGLKQNNSEKDQSWSRPPLPDRFSEATHDITFQQIEAEEGTLHGGKTSVRLFGVTEV